MATYPLADAVRVPYADVVNPGANLAAAIEKAYGYNGLGILVVTDVPELLPLREALLPKALEFAKLPEEIQAQYEHSASHYSFGWSHGKEKLKKGQFGSYYNNPQYDVPSTDPEAIACAPEVLSANIWPTEHIPTFEKAFKDLGSLVCDVGQKLAVHVDRYVQSVHPTYKPQLADLIATTRCTKARLLHYYPLDFDGDRAVDSWCGWHNDHSALTGLTPNMFMNVDTNVEVPNPDPESGLYARSRDDKIVKVAIAPNSLAYQIGECTQVLSGGAVRATPHAVRAIRYPASEKISRETFAVFMQPAHDFVLAPPQGVDSKDAAVGQFKEGMTFGEFGRATIQFYYANDGGY